MSNVKLFTKRSTQGCYLFHQTNTKLESLLTIMFREVCKKSKWKFKMAFAIRRPTPPPHWTSRGYYHLQPKLACRRVFVLQITKTASTSEVDIYKRCDQIRFEYRCTVYKLVKTLHCIHLHCIIID